MPTEPTTPPTISALSEAPVRGQSNFATIADAFAASWVTVTTQFVSFRTWMNTTATQVFNNATEAATSATNAATSESAAASVVGASEWVSEASYSENDAVISPTNKATYRAKTNHSGLTAEPEDDDTNWSPIITFKNVILEGSIAEDTFSASWSGSRAVDSANGTRQTITMTGTVNATDSLEDGEHVSLRILNGDIHTWNHPAGTLFVEGQVPILGGDDRITYEKWGSDLICYAGVDLS